MARASGLTASALRFYGDCGLLTPSVVDEVTGYRYYAPAQCERAVLIRRLRDIEVPLAEVAQILAGDPEQATRVLDRHVAALTRRARTAAAVAEQLRGALTGASPAGTAVVVEAAAFARAVAQVADAAARDRSIPVLAGVLLEADETGLTATATDRYRLATRSLAPLRAGGEPWSAVVEAADLAALVQDDTGDELTVELDETGMRLTGRAPRHLPCLAEPFPDYRAVLDGLAPVRTRVLVGRRALLDLLESTPEAPLGLDIDATGLTPRRSAAPIPAAVTGPSLRIAFDPAVLRPAVDCALGPDLMLDLAGPDQPVVVRSATDGDLTVLVMPMLDRQAA